MLSAKTTITGDFQHTGTKVWFSYAPTINPWALEHGLTHEIDIIDGVRFARILKTVAHVAVDETVDGLPVLETWSIKRAVS